MNDAAANDQVELAWRKRHIQQIAEDGRPGAELRGPGRLRQVEAKCVRAPFLELLQGPTVTAADDVLLPDPAPRPIRVPVISVDDHLIEPPDMFEGRMPAHLAERAPRIVERDDGVQHWLYEDRTYPNVGLNAVAGRRRAGCFETATRRFSVKRKEIHGSVR